MTTKQQTTLEVGTTTHVPLKVSKDQTILVTVAIVDRRMAFGREEWLVTPLEGEGSAWMTTQRILSAQDKGGT